MFGSLLFGFYHHFLVASPDHIHSQSSGGWGTTFVLTAYLLLITEAIGTYVGVHFFGAAKETTSALMGRGTKKSRLSRQSGFARES
jgi:hypothetical protein